MSGESEIPPGRPRPETQAMELAFWSSHLTHWDLHLPTYRRIFPFDDIEYEKMRVLDVGSGPISVFEKMAPAAAQIIPYDPLANEYNQLAVEKRFPIVQRLPSDGFELITLFNCLDHMDRPAELLEQLSPLLTPNGSVWICCHVNRPFGADAHPQDFRFWHLIALTDQAFRLRRCGLARDGRLFPYVWWGVCGRRADPPTFRDSACRTLFVILCGLQFARFHLTRALIKGAKIVGLRRLLPEDLRF